MPGWPSASPRRRASDRPRFTPSRRADSRDSRVEYNRMNDLAKNLMLWVVVAVVLMVVFNSFSPKMGEGKEVVYSQFQEDVVNDRIKKIEFGPDERTVTFERKDSTQGTTIAPNRDAHLVDDLLKHNVEIKQAPPASGPSIWQILINFLP